MTFSGIDTVYAPFTDEQVQSLNGFQKCGVWHPFTGNSGEPLTATNAGWVEGDNSRIVQDWAHKFMTNGDWRKRLPDWSEST